MKRRTWLLAGLGATGALVVGWSALPQRKRLDAGDDLLEAPGDHVINGWLKISNTDRITVMLARTELGQGVATTLPMLLCDELDGDWGRIDVAAAPVDGIYNNVSTVVDGLPLHPDDTGWVAQTARRLSAKAARDMGLMITGGSSSVKDLWLPMRQAGATARRMLLAAAAETWQVPVGECQADQGTVRHPATNRQLRYGALAALAARQSVPRQVSLKTPDQYRLIGRSTSRIDSAAKQTGYARFGLDQRLPDMRYASLTMGPWVDGRLARVDGAAAKALPGVSQVLSLPALHGAPEAVAVVADHPWRALKGVRALQTEWTPGPSAAFSDAQIERALERALGDDGGHTWVRQGKVSDAFDRAARVIKADYQAPLLAHAPMEPGNCTVLFDPPAKLALVWAGTQVPGLARSAVAKVLGLADDQVHVHVPLVGGSFGRRLEVDVVAQAAEIARHNPGIPVQTFWSREEETAHDFFRPPCHARWEAALSAEGLMLGVRARSAGPSVMAQYAERQFGFAAPGPDKTTAEGAYDQPYGFPSALIQHQVVDLPLPVGAWRSVGHSHQAFFTESFLDECAAAMGQDPLDYRLILLQQHPRARAVLQRAAAMAGWHRPPAPAPDGAPTAWGLALHRSFGTLVAQAAQVSLDPMDGRRIRVHQIKAAVDCGQVINPNLAKQQIEGGILFGLSAALHGGVSFSEGRVIHRNFDALHLLRLTEAPSVQVDLVLSQELPAGLGEPGVPPVAPAVANAVFRLTGQRLRRLPLQLA